MLPGFRFLLAAIVLSTSMLVFGLGAAALLRAAHEQFASNPSWHAAPEATFAQQIENASPVLAMLHADPAVTEPTAPDNISGSNSGVISNSAAQAPNTALTNPTVTSTPDQPSITPVADGPAKLAALKPEQTSALDPSKSLVRQDPAQDPTPRLPAPVRNETAGSEAGMGARPALESDSTPRPTKQAALAPVMPPGNDTVAAETVPAQSDASAAGSLDGGEATSPETDAISTKLALLDGRSIVQPKPRPAAAIARAEQAAIRRRLQARLAARQRKIEAQARQATLLPPPPFPPFPQQFNQPPAVSRNN